MMFSCINSRVFTTYAKEIENLAKNAVVTGSDVENGTTFVAKNVTDGSKSTRWATNHISEGKNAWLQLAYEKPITFSTIKIYWEAARAIKYSIMTSLDGIDWDTVYSESNGSGNLDSITLSESKNCKIYQISSNRRPF
jgi:F5/8 type C domain.